jgi:peptide/nickel transport system permease protein
MSIPADPLLVADDVALSDTPGQTTEAPDVVVRGRRQLVLRRLRRNRAAMGALVVLLLLFVAAFLGPVIYKAITGWTYSEQDFSTGLAAIVGAVAGYFGGWVDRALMWIVDLLLVIPSFLIIAIIARNMKDGGWIMLVLLIAVFAWMITARIIRGMTLSLREREFVLAARYSGVSSAGIIFRHLIPNMSSLLIIDATIAVATAIIAESGLSYFGFGVKPPDVSLGTLIADGTQSAFTFPWLFMFAGGLLVLTTLAVSVFGDGLRDALDPASNRAGGGK